MLIPPLHSGIVRAVLRDQIMFRNYVKNLAVWQVKYHCMGILPGTVQFSSTKTAHMSPSIMCLGHFRIL